MLHLLWGRGGYHGEGEVSLEYPQAYDQPNNPGSMHSIPPDTGRSSPYTGQV